MSDWKEISKNPNLERIRLERRELINQVLRPFPVDRISFITDLVSGKRTLDIGFVAPDADYEALTDWLHGYVAKAASYCLGADILEADVELLRARGYNVRVHDITRSPLAETFDVIICGEIAEHIGNIDGLFANSLKCLSPGGQLVVTTPYPW